MAKVIFKDKAGNKLIRYKSGAYAVKNRRGKIVTKKEFFKFIRKHKL